MITAIALLIAALALLTGWAWDLSRRIVGLEQSNVRLERLTGNLGELTALQTTILRQHEDEIRGREMAVKKPTIH